MKIFKVCVIAILVFALFYPLLSQASGQARNSQADDLDRDTYQSLKEDIEIMRRVIIKALGQYVEDQGWGNVEHKKNLNEYFGYEDETEYDDDTDNPFYKAKSAYDAYTYTWGGSLFQESFGSRGIYVPGSGAVFTFEVDIPAKSDDVDEESEEEEEDDLWSETEKEYKQKHITNLFTQNKQRTWTLEPGAREEVIRLLVGTVARHGYKIEALGEDEMVTIILKLNGKRPLDRAAVASGDVGLSVYSYWSLGNSTGLTEEVIIQVPLLDGMRKGDLNRIMKSCRILRFHEKKTDKDRSRNKRKRGV